MGEKEFNTNEVEEEMSLSGQLSRRRRQRRMTEESNSSAVGADEKNADSIGDASELSADWSDCGYCVNQPKRF